MRILAGMILLAALLSASSCSGSGQSKLKKDGAAIAEKIEAFKSKNSRLPQSLSEIGIRDSEEGPLYYRKTSDSSYEIWFGAELGESVTYDSRSQTWNR